MAGITVLPQEIILLIADYLDRRDHHRLATTCHNLYRSLVSLLWKEVYIQSDFPRINITLNGERVHILPDRPVITSTRLEQHAFFVDHLSLHGPFSSEHYAIVFPQLHTLGIYLDTSYHVPSDDNYVGFNSASDTFMRAEQHRHRARLIQLNPTIKEIKIRTCDPQPTADFWNAISSTLSEPTRLYVSDLSRTGGETLASFWKACTLFEEIDCWANNLEATRVMSQLSFPRLKRVSFYSSDKFDQGFCTEDQVAWFRRCSNLTRLHWTFDLHKFPASKFREALEQESWPNLEDLSLEELDRWDDALAVTLSHLPPLRRFRLRSAEFGPLTFNTLRTRIFGTLRALDLTGNVYVTSRMALDVLTECVHLEDFSGVIIYAQEIDNESQPWACLGLERLSTIIICSPDASTSKNAFEALSRLTRLTTLDIGLDKLEISELSYLVPRDMRHLPWSLEYGLGQLSTLTKLRTVSLVDSNQELLTDEDVEWTVDNLPALEQVRGRLCVDPVRQKRLTGVLGRCGVLHVDVGRHQQ
ncbi:hypothetical protein BGZ96_004150 [Linnemannia gamsii]|uniref:F-box domain-containing protein n=1 Tax=Linnemannia gamsii TaxID=64522 RepID=A0ABQ7K7A7_9FUNG|nr:hypothetical protein BGZ96_004150 [Linnemannia gamsii]